MKRHANIDLPRRRLIRALFTIPALGAVACNQATADTGAPLVTGPTSLEPTPVCDDGMTIPPHHRLKARTSRAPPANVRRSSKRA